MSQKLVLSAICIALGLGLSACDSSAVTSGQDSQDNSQNKGATSDWPAPYAVVDSERPNQLAELVSLRKKLIALEGVLIAPAKEDLNAYDDLLANQNTGLARLFPRDDSDRPDSLRPLLINGEGAYYQFKGRKNRYGQGSDVKYSISGSEPQFSVGFAGVDYGFFGALGNVDIRQVDDRLPGVAFALNHTPPNGQPEPAWRTEQARWREGATAADGIRFDDRVRAVVGMSYVVRSVSEGRYDIAAVFQVVRRDPADGSVIIAWKLLREFAVPQLKRD